MTRPTAVFDTSTLLNLATLVVSEAASAPSGADPLRVALSVTEPHIPRTVLAELTTTSESDDLPGVAATAVLRGSAALTTHDVPAGPDYGLDAGEARAVRLANALDADLFVTDEFGGANFALIHLAVDDRESVRTTPELLAELAEAGHIDDAYVDAALTYLQGVKGWDGVYVDRVRERYLEP